MHKGKNLYSAKEVVYFAEIAMRKGPHTMIILNILLFLFMSATAYSASAGPVEVQSIQIVPSETTVGRHPEISGIVKATKVLRRDETLVITVIAVVVRPDHVVKSWTWKNVRMRTDDIRSFTIPNDYELKLAGTYKVDFNVYTRNMLPLYRLSKKFVAVDRKLPSTKTKPPEGDKARIEAASGRAAGRQAEYPHLGVGLYADTLHSTGGATMLLWPFKHVGLQASYSVGSFSIAEGRILARLPLSSGITPYLGAGYLKVTTERAVEIIGIKTGFQDSGVSGVIGVEVPLVERMFGSIELSGASIKLKKEVATGSTTGTASVKYAPVTIGINIVYHLF
jgi:hypothetical protein